MKLLRLFTISVCALALAACVHETRDYLPEKPNKVNFTTLSEARNRVKMDGRKVRITGLSTFDNGDGRNGFIIFGPNGQSEFIGIFSVSDQVAARELETSGGDWITVDGIYSNDSVSPATGSHKFGMLREAIPRPSEL